MMTSKEVTETPMDGRANPQNALHIAGLQQ